MPEKKILLLDSYNKRYPPLPEGTIVYVKPRSWSVATLTKEVYAASGVGVITIAKAVICTIYLLQENRNVRIARPRLHKATTEELLEL